MNRNYLNEFYSKVIDFLTRNKLEVNIEGYEDLEIKSCEIAYSVQFPKAYRLFLSLMAKSDLRIFDFQDYTLSGINDAQKVSKELLENDDYILGENKFVFAQWQGYNFFYIDLEKDNPNVELYIQAGCASEDAPPEIHKCGEFTNWL